MLQRLFFLKLKTKQILFACFFVLREKRQPEKMLNLKKRQTNKKFFLSKMYSHIQKGVFYFPCFCYKKLQSPRQSNRQNSPLPDCKISREQDRQTGKQINKQCTRTYSYTDTQNRYQVGRQTDRQNNNRRNITKIIMIFLSCSSI